MDPINIFICPTTSSSPRDDGHDGCGEEAGGHHHEQNIEVVSLASSPKFLSTYIMNTLNSMKKTSQTETETDTDNSSSTSGSGSGDNGNGGFVDEPQEEEESDASKSTKGGDNKRRRRRKFLLEIGRAHV